MVTKGQISDGTISKNKCHQEYYLCKKFHAFMKKCTIFGFCHYTIMIVYEQINFYAYNIETYIYCTCKYRCSVHMLVCSSSFLSYYFISATNTALYFYMVGDINN